MSSWFLLEQSQTHYQRGREVWKRVFIALAAATSVRILVQNSQKWYGLLMIKVLFLQHQQLGLHGCPQSHVWEVRKGNEWSLLQDKHTELCAITGHWPRGSLTLWPTWPNMEETMLPRATLDNNVVSKRSTISKTGDGTQSEMDKIRHTGRREPLDRKCLRISRKLRFLTDSLISRWTTHMSAVTWKKFGSNYEMYFLSFRDKDVSSAANF